MKRLDHSLDEIFMLECLSLARKGAGSVSPNPMVGAVIVKQGRILARGWHTKFGGPHAEVNAIYSAKKSIQGSTLYVNLEPCSYHGKTPPCTELIIAAGIREVAVGIRDPNPMVNGKGIRELRRAGIIVREGICSEECRQLNEAFAKFVTTAIPYVALKIAQTLDGKIADMRGRSRWITGSASRRLVHELRSRYDAVLVGAGTVIKDDPQLTARSQKTRNPLRVIIDGQLRSPLTSRVFRHISSAPTIVFASSAFLRRNSGKASKLLAQGVEVAGLPGKPDGTIALRRVLNVLGSRGIISILVEGGATLFGSFVRQDLADKAYIFIAPKILGHGLSPFVRLPARTIGTEIRLSTVRAHRLNDDTLVEAYLH